MTRMTKAINFAFGCNIPNGPNALSNQPFIGSGIVNIPFRVKEVVVKEMFSAPLNTASTNTLGFIGGENITLVAPGTQGLISQGMTISGVGVQPGTQVVSIYSSTSLLCNIIQAVPSTTFTYYTSMPYASSIGTTLTLINPNEMLITGQILSGINFTTCTLGVQLSNLTWTISVSQTGTYILLYSSATTPTSTIGGNILRCQDEVDVAVGTVVTGTGVTGGTTITGGFGGDFIVNNNQVVLPTTLTLVDPNNNYTLSEQVQVNGMDELFPFGSCLGCLTMGTDLVAATNYQHDNHHVYSEPKWFRGEYNIQLLKADGVLPPTDNFVGHVCVICEFISE